MVDCDPWPSAPTVAASRRSGDLQIPAELEQVAHDQTDHHGERRHGDEVEQRHAADLADPRRLTMDPMPSTTMHKGTGLIISIGLTNPVRAA